MNLTGKRFKINSIVEPKEYLFKGTIINYIKKKENYQYYKVNLEIPIIYKNERIEKPLKGEIAVNRENFWLITESSLSNEMMNYTKQLEWLDEWIIFYLIVS